MARAKAQSMNANFSQNFQYADKHMGASIRLFAHEFHVGPEDVLIPSEKEDKKECKDFKIRYQGSELVALSRIRRENGYAIAYFDMDFTIRAWPKNNLDLPMELEKIFHKSYGDVMLYALSDVNYDITRWRLLRMRSFRDTFYYDKKRHLVLSRQTGLSIGAMQSNRDENDTVFWACPLIELPDNALYRGEKLPRKPDPAAGTFFEGLHLNA